MRRLHLAMWIVFPLLALSLTLPGCGKEENGRPRRVRKNKDKGSGSGTAKTPVQSDGMATLTGFVEFTGDEGVLKARTESRAVQIREKNEPHCLKATPEELAQQTFYVGKNKKVGNVFVWVEPAEDDKFFALTQAEADKHNANKELRQPHCTFIPHCLVLFPLYKDKAGKPHETGQRLIVVNDAAIAHNATLQASVVKKTTGVMGKETKSEPLLFRPENTAIKISCGIHPWMGAVARAYEHPYATLTKVAFKAPENDKFAGVDFDAADFGTFKLEVPAGAKLKLFAWHEEGEYLNEGGAKGQDIELDKGSTKEITFKMGTQ